jgi:hypothetical protein
LYPVVCELAMLSEMCPIARDCALMPLTAVNIAPRILIADLFREMQDLVVSLMQGAGQVPIVEIIPLF